MTELKQLLSDYNDAKKTTADSAEKEREGIAAKDQLTLKIQKTKECIKQLEWQVKRAKSHGDVSPQDFTLFKNELDEKINQLNSSYELLLIHKNYIKELGNESRRSRGAQSEILQKMTHVLANTAGDDFLSTPNDKLKLFVDRVLVSNTYKTPRCYSSHLRPDEFLYHEVGKRICSELFPEDNGQIQLPRTDEIRKNTIVELENL